MFSRFFRRRGERDRSPAEARESAGGSRLGNAMRSAFRRVFHRRPTRVGIEGPQVPLDFEDSQPVPPPVEQEQAPMHLDTEPPTPPRRAFRASSDASSLSIRLADDQPAESRDSPYLTLTLDANVRNDANALNLFRDELINALAMALLEQQEQRAAEAELTILQRRENLAELQQSLLQVQEQYRTEVRAIIQGRDIEAVSYREFDSVGMQEGRLILARQMFAIESRGVELLAARARHGDESPEAHVFTEALDRQVLLLGRICHDALSMDQLALFERRAALADSADEVQLLTLPALGVEFETLYRDGAVASMRTTLAAATADLAAAAFKVKCQTMRIALLRERSGGKFGVSVRREYIVSDSRNVVMHASQADLRRRLVVKYQGEDGNDFGGLARDWLCELSQRVVQPLVASGVLRPSVNDPARLQIAPMLSPSPDTLRELEFLGRLTGLALFHGKIVGVSFVESVYKAILGFPCGLADIASIDQSYHTALVDVLSTADVAPYTLFFCVDYVEEGGATKTFNLVPRGDQRAVVNCNRGEYVDLLVKWFFGRSIEQQLAALRRGIEAVFDLDALSLFTPPELAELAAGRPTVNVDEWRAHTSYENGYTADSQPVRWFWQALASFPPEKQCQVLKFVTGASRAPAQGFGSLSAALGHSCFTLYRNEALDSLPVGHTCVNRLDLPAYRSYDMLVAKLTTAIEETEGFGIV
eukprot:m.35851 g.35851  ORF g.35851 m.35851 type:complete len:705 (+) comp9623_c0_seq2:245-2359(+)